MIKKYFNQIRLGAIAAFLLVGAGLFVVVANAATVVTSYYYTYSCVSDACKAAERAAAEAREASAAAASEKNEYQAEVGRKNGEIATIQADISQNQAEIDDLTVKIENNLKKLDQLRESIKKTVVKLYLEKDVSGLEIIASSDSVVDFTTKQSNQEVIQAKIKSIVEETKKFKSELETQQQLVLHKKQDNEARSAEVEQARGELASMAAEWAGREAEYANVAKEKESERVALMTAQQHAVQQILGGPSSNQQCGGGYPYCNYGINAGADPWNLFYRQCVSYTAWRVHNAYGYMPKFGGFKGYETSFWSAYRPNIPNNGSVSGHALYWLDQAATMGIPYGSTPKVGSVGVMGPTASNWYGHVVWVEAVNGDSIWFSDYNRAGVGMYGESSAHKSAFTYIYFGDWNR
jgi:Uncharacterized protein conserved in bacteria